MFSTWSRAEDGVPMSPSRVEHVRAAGSVVVFFMFADAVSHRNVGIGVDVHVHRITNRLAWHKPPTKTPEETR